MIKIALFETSVRKFWGLYRADHGSHIHQDDGRTERGDGLLSEAGTPERLIAGIVAGLTIGIDGEDCACRMGGLEVYAGDFVGVVVGGIAGSGVGDMVGSHEGGQPSGCCHCIVHSFGIERNAEPGITTREPEDSGV